MNMLPGFAYLSLFHCLCCTEVLQLFFPVRVLCMICEASKKYDWLVEQLNCFRVWYYNPMKKMLSTSDSSMHHYFKAKSLVKCISVECT